MLDQIVAKTDGVPLFVEETTKAVIESAVVDDADDPTMAGLSDQVPVPTSLHDSLVSRLDRLGPAKDVAQTAAVIGRSFGEHMLAALCGPRENFAASLDRLVGAEVVDVDSSRSASETVYRFRHALLRDVAYASLLKSTRRRLHREIADVLAGAAKPELLAYHQRHAGLLQEAVDSYLLAGRSLMQRGAYLEAENSYRNALVLLDQADEHNVADPERSLRMHLGAGSNATALHGWADGRTFRAYQTARSLAAELDDREGQVMSLAALGFSHGDRGEPQAGIACAEQILELDASTPLHRFIGHAAMAMPAFFHGEFARSSEHARAALTTYEEWMDPYLSELGGPYVPTLCRIYSGWNAWFLGDEDASARWIDVALDAVPESRQPFSHGYTLVFGTILAFFRDDVEAQFDWAMRAVEVGNRYGFQFFSGIGEVFLASARTETEPGPERVAELEAGLAKAGSEDHRSGLPTMLDLVSRIQQKLGAIDAAAETITTAQETAAATHQHYWEPELHRRRGELALVSGDVEQAATAYREAIATASAIGAVALEDRAAASLVALDTG